MLGKVPGLTYIDLKWNKSDGADTYVVYVNDTRKEETKENEISIVKLERSTFYSFRVASKNIAGVGNKSEAVTIKTSDISEFYVFICFHVFVPSLHTHAHLHHTNTI